MTRSTSAAPTDDPDCPRRLSPARSKSATRWLSKVNRDLHLLWRLCCARRAQSSGFFFRETGWQSYPDSRDFASRFPDEQKKAIASERAFPSGLGGFGVSFLRCSLRCAPRNSRLSSASASAPSPPEIRSDLPFAPLRKSRRFRPPARPGKVAAGAAAPVGAAEASARKSSSEIRCRPDPSFSSHRPRARLPPHPPSNSDPEIRFTWNH